jgi:hypothetical protein
MDRSLTILWPSTSPSGGESARGELVGDMPGLPEVWETRETVLVWDACEVTEGEAESPFRSPLSIVTGTKPVPWSSTAREVSAGC